MRQNLDQEIRDIYKLDDRAVRVWRLIKSELSPENVELLERYETEMINLGIAKATRIKHLQIMLTITRKINKKWPDVTKPDIDKLVKDVMNQYGDRNGDETESSRDFKKILKLFFRWLKLGSREYKEVGDPPETKGIRLRKPKDKITRENLLVEDDRTKLLNACGENMRDRAFIDVHLEAGTRPGEILSLQIKHVEFDKIGSRIHVDGKTGARPIRLIRSTPNLAAWINAHPFRKNPEAPLWILLDSENYGKSMTYVAAKAMVERRCKMANLPKRVNLKLFRHTAATNMAKFLTDAEMKKRHGWTRTSNMPARYAHIG
ncbi:MAG: site-specific integrase [Candidatus Nitrosotenuis sp.]